MIDAKLSVREVAEFHGVSEKTVRRWISSGHLHADRVGPKLLRIDRTEMYLLSKPVEKGSRRKQLSQVAPPPGGAAGRDPEIEPWQPAKQAEPKKKRIAPVAPEATPKGLSRRSNRNVLRHEPS
jgi:excisionase family DNA binding protein